MTTLHILCSPNKPVHSANRTDPFAIAVIKFVQNMEKLDYHCIVYTIVGSEVPCEKVECLSFLYNQTTKNIEEYNRNAGQEIRKRKKSDDLIMCFHGWENQGATLENQDLIIVEPSIGYDIKAIFAPYRVFTSYAQMHMFYGHKDMLMTPSWYDAVIPNAFTASEFSYCEDKDDYFLIFGRVIENKGIHIAIQATAHTGKKLVIAGPGNLQELGYAEIPGHVEYVGVCDVDQRRELMSKAKAILGPTYYVEPFGNMIAEGYFSGTPAITSDWGGFVDTVIPGRTGFRCREFREFIDAIEKIEQIKTLDCLTMAMNNYEETVVHKKFDLYFQKLQAGNFYR
jgi:glycosyltransferase involved in cell wall biosynthesis